MIETAGIALATFFATIGPLDAAAIFASLTTTSSPAHKRSMAVRGTLVGTVILLVFAFIGELVLTGFGISLAALRTAGGILLLLIGIEMVFARSSGGTSTTEEEEREAATKPDISAFPIGTPLIAGPGAISATILLMTDAQGNWGAKAIIVSSLLIILLITMISMLLATQIQRLLGVTGMQVVGRVFGVLLCALAVQFVFDGIMQSDLLTS